MIKMNKILTLIVSCVLLCSVVQAGEVKLTSSIKNDSMQLFIQNANDKMKILAESTGTGKTLEEAKLSAYNRILPFLIDKTSNVGIIKSSPSVDGVEKGKGVELIAGKIVLHGSWELVEAIYHYELSMILLHDNEEEEVRSKLEYDCFDEVPFSPDELRAIGYAEGISAADAKERAIQNATDNLSEKVFPEMVKTTDQSIYSLEVEQREMKEENNITEEQKRYVREHSEVKCSKVVQNSKGIYQGYVTLTIPKKYVKRYQK